MQLQALPQVARLPSGTSTTGLGLNGCSINHWARQGLWPIRVRPYRRRAVHMRLMLGHFDVHTRLCCILLQGLCNTQFWVLLFKHHGMAQGWLQSAKTTAISSQFHQSWSSQYRLSTNDDGLRTLFRTRPSSEIRAWMPRGRADSDLYGASHTTRTRAMMEPLR